MFAFVYPLLSSANNVGQNCVLWSPGKLRKWPLNVQARATISHLHARKEWDQAQNSGASFEGSKNTREGTPKWDDCLSSVEETWSKAERCNGTTSRAPNSDYPLIRTRMVLLLYFLQMYSTTSRAHLIFSASGGTAHGDNDAPVVATFTLRCHHDAKVNSIHRFVSSPHFRRWSEVRVSKTMFGMLVSPLWAYFQDWVQRNAICFFFGIDFQQSPV